MQDRVTEHWQIRKPAVHGDGGLVATQHYLASEVGADILRRGGNAVDAAVAAGLALGTVEPWMSGIGGGGYMTIYSARDDAVSVVEFGMRAPFASTPADYPLVPGAGTTGTFNWQAVVGNVNVEGPLAIAVPGYVKGVSLALEQFGTLEWADVIEPACRLAEAGLPIDWYASQKITGLARPLSRFDETRRVYLGDGLPPVANVDGTLKRLPLGRLAETYRRLQSDGPHTFYMGDLAQEIVTDLQAVRSKIDQADLSEYSARVAAPLSDDYRGAKVHVPGHMTAGPSLVQALQHLQTHLQRREAGPGPDAFVTYAEALRACYDYRLANIGEGPSAKLPTNTSHLCTADKDGNLVSLTQTIMSGFGARIMLPRTGILMNNGMMWFDPRPGMPNSVEGGRRPLCNMCPAVVELPDGGMFAVGACGGRKIFPAVFQLISFLVDYGMDVDTAVHHPRLDVSGTDVVSVMDSADPAIVAALESRYEQARVRPNGVSPNSFALPQVVARHADGTFTGAAFIPSPHAKVVAA
jgi:gamma-glutamyltranspeptidase/glutathione hydrolase